MPQTYSSQLGVSQLIVVHTHLQPEFRIGYVCSLAGVGDGNVRLYPTRGAAKLQLTQDPEAANANVQRLVCKYQLRGQRVWTLQCRIYSYSPSYRGVGRNSDALK